MNLYSISGYWQGEEDSKFEGYLVCDYDQTPDGYDDDEIFFYGLSEENIKQAIEDGEEDVLQGDFVITSHEIHAEDV